MKEKLYLTAKGWMLALFLLAGFATFISCSDDDDPVDPAPPYIGLMELLKPLERLDNLRTMASHHEDYPECYSFYYKVPENHFPDDPTFPPTADSLSLRVLIQFLSYDAPTVIYNDGGALTGKVPPLARYLNANVIEVQYRYFGNNYPDDFQPDPSWPYLYASQNAADLHDLVTTLKPLFTGKWVASGKLDGGIETALYAYYYPGEMDLYVPFCTPFFQDLHDPSVGRWLNEGIATADIRERWTNLYKQCLRRQDSLLLPLWQSDNLNPIYFGESMYNILMNRHYVWMMNSHPSVVDAALPRGEASDDELVRLLSYDNLEDYLKEADTQSSRHASTSFSPAIGSSLRSDLSQAKATFADITYQSPFYPHALREYGYFDIDPSYYQEEADLGLLDPTEAVNYIGTEAEQETITYSNRLILDFLHRFLPQTTSRMVFVYGQYDPITGAAIQQTTGTYQGNSHVDCIVIPDCSHDDSFTDYSGPEVERLSTLIREAMQ